MSPSPDKNGGYAPDCIDCPTKAECRAANDCLVLRQIRHPHPFARSNVEPPAHTDHPLRRHFDRTCDACVAEEVLTVLRDADFHDAADHLLGRRLRVAAPSHALPNTGTCKQCGYQVVHPGVSAPSTTPRSGGIDPETGVCNDHGVLACEWCVSSPVLPDHQSIADMLPSILKGGELCPLCGQSGVHTHSPEEILIYRNGVKYGRSLASAIAPNDEALEKANGRIAALHAKLAESRREYDELETRSATPRIDHVTEGTVEQDAARFRFLTRTVTGEIRHVGSMFRRWRWDTLHHAEHFPKAIDAEMNRADGGKQT